MFCLVVDSGIFSDSWFGKGSDWCGMMVSHVSPVVVGDISAKSEEEQNTMTLNKCGTESNSLDFLVGG